MVYLTLSDTVLADLLTSLNAQNVPATHIVGFLHDGTNYILLYWK